MFEREKAIVLFWGVCLEVVLQGMLWVDECILLGPKNVFALLLCGLGLRKENNGFFAVIMIFDIVLYVQWFDVEVGIETDQFWDSDLSETGSPPEGGHEACEDS